MEINPDFVIKSHMAALAKYRSYIYNLIPIQTGKGMEFVKPHPYQIDLLNNTFLNKKKIIIYKCRQIGSTVNLDMHVYLKLSMEKYRNILYASKTEIEAIDFMTRLYQIYDNSPKWLQALSPILKRTQSECEFSNGSRLRAATTTESTGRAGAYTDVILDEYAFIEINKFKFFTSVLGSITQTDGNIIVNSTPNGLEHFYALWNGAESGENGFHPVYLGFFSVPGRTQEQHDAIIKSFPSVEEGLQEHHRTPEEGFIASGRPVFNISNLKNMIKNTAEAPYVGFLYEKNKSIYFEQANNEKLFIWKHPIYKDEYRIGVDPAEGYDGDYSVIIVKHAKTFEQVAMFRSNKIDTHDVANILYRMAKYYNESLVCVERNNDGKTILERLYHTLEYTNVYFEEHIDTATREKTKKYGWPETRGNKDHLIAIQQRHITAMDIKINSKVIIQEHMTFYIQDNLKKMGNAGCHDDSVVADSLATMMCEMYPQNEYSPVYNRRMYDRETGRASGYG